MATEYKDYILDFLFLKYISDVWAEHYEEARKAYGEDEERIRRRMARERFGFISHMVEAAKTREGRVGIVVPHGVLFRGGAEGRIRQALIEENLLDAVIGLPSNLFPTTGIPVAILVFDRAREAGGAHEGRRDVMMIDASREFREGKRQNALEDAHVARIVETHRARGAVERYARPVPIAEITANDFNLNISRYIDTAETEAEIDIAAVEREIESLEGELAELRGKMKAHLRELGLHG